MKTTLRLFFFALLAPAMVNAATSSTATDDVADERSEAPHELETLTRDIALAPGQQATSLESLSGAITVGRDARVSGNVETEFGPLRLEPGAEVSGRIENDSGPITILGAHVGGRIATTNGDIEIGPDSLIDGGILVHERGLIGISLGSFRLGVPLPSEPPRIVIGPGATVNGTLRFKRAVKLYVSERARIGSVEGATPILFAGDRPE